MQFKWALGMLEHKTFSVIGSKFYLNFHNQGGGNHRRNVATPICRVETAPTYIVRVYMGIFDE